MEKIVCMDCKSEFEIRTKKRGSAFIEFILWSTFVIPGYFYGLWRRAKTKKTCDYCGSNFLLPASSAYELLAIKK
ncbi:MAG: hypothetical protein FJ368_03400 [Pelagibacterales bacterium]|nr:hypothetical protein [Pelagibacterales bacterium]